MLDPDAAAILDRMSQLGLPPVGTVTAAEMRALRAKNAPAPLPAPKTLSIDDVTIPAADGRTIPARLYRPDEDEGPLIVFFHGGGWAFGGLGASDLPVRLLAEATTRPVLSVDYRLAPENPFPAAAEDALAATLWAMDTNADTRNGQRQIIIAGESAGANLSAALAQELARRNVPLLGQILSCPLVSATVSALVPLGFQSPFLTVAEVEWFLDQYVPDPVDREDPRVSPALAPDLRGLAPAFVATAEHDFLRFQGEDYAERLQAAGVKVEARHYAGTFHGFLELACLTSAAATLRRDLRQFIDGLAPAPASL